MHAYWKLVNNGFEILCILLNNKLKNKLLCRAIVLLDLLKIKNLYISNILLNTRKGIRLILYKA